MKLQRMHVGSWRGGWVFGRFILQSGEDSDLNPLRMMVLVRRMIILSLLRCAVQPESHSKPMDIRAPAGRWGKIWASLAAGGRRGRFKWQMWVDLINDPFGISTEIGFVAIFLL